MNKTHVTLIANTIDSSEFDFVESNSLFMRDPSLRTCAQDDEFVMD